MGRYYKRTIDQPMPVGRTSGRQTLARLPFGGSVLFPARRAAAHRQRSRRVSSARASTTSITCSPAAPTWSRPKRNAGARQSRRADPARGDQHRGNSRVRPRRQLRDAVLGNARRSSRSTCATSRPRSRGSAATCTSSSPGRTCRSICSAGSCSPLIGIFSVAYANYLEDRRTLALLRIRGAGPSRRGAVLPAQRAWPLADRARDRGG